MSLRIRREQICSRCRNHGMMITLKGHKKTCEYLLCDCEKCSETKERQNYIAREIAFHRRNSKEKHGNRKKKIPEIKFRENSDCDATCEVRKYQMCARCRNHDQDHPIRGHKNNCPFATCACDKCQITKERRKIMAKQIRDYRLNRLPDDVDSGYSGSPETERDIKFSNSAEDEEEEVDVEMDERNQFVLQEEDETFYTVQSLYEKYFFAGSEKNKMEFLYAFVLLTNKNWLMINKALLQGSLMAKEKYQQHIDMAVMNHQISLARLQSLPAASALDELQQQVVRIKAMGGNF